jgi:hypothetical protein
VLDLSNLLVCVDTKDERYFVKSGYKALTNLHQNKIQIEEHPFDQQYESLKYYLEYILSYGELRVMICQ